MTYFKVSATFVGLMLGLASPALSEEPTSTSAQLAAKVTTKPEVSRLTIKRPSNVLFVGNSYFYYNDSLHNHVERLAITAGLFKEGSLEYKSATIGGAALFDHNIDHLLNPKKFAR